METDVLELEDRDIVELKKVACNIGQVGFVEGLERDVGVISRG